MSPNSCEHRAGERIKFAFLHEEYCQISLDWRGAFLSHVRPEENTWAAFWACSLVHHKWESENASLPLEQFLTGPVTGLRLGSELQVCSSALCLCM